MFVGVLGCGLVAVLLGGRQLLPPTNAKPMREPKRVVAGNATTPSITSAKIVTAARAQLGTLYDPAYVVLSYPNGDVPKNRGACTDVVIRALRAAGYDLQKLMHDDMRGHFSLYPRKWGLRRPDKNIDHRRVPNQMAFFRRHGRELTKTVSKATLPTWQPGDIVCWVLPTGQDHTGIVSDARNSAGIPFVIHNLSVCSEEDVLTAWKIQGHFRYPAHGGRR